MTRSVGSHVTANVILLLLAVTVVLGLYSTFLAHALWHDVDLLQERVSALEAITIDQANSIAGLTDNLAYLSGLAVPVAPSRLGPYSLGITSNGARMTLSLKGLDRVVFSWSLDGKATYWWVNDPYGNQYASSGVVYFSEGSAAFVVPVDGEYSIWFANADPPNKCMVTLYVTVYHSSALSAAGVSQIRGEVWLVCKDSGDSIEVRPFGEATHKTDVETDVVRWPTPDTGCHDVRAAQTLGLWRADSQNEVDVPMESVVVVLPEEDGMSCVGLVTYSRKMYEGHAGQYAREGITDLPGSLYQVVCVEVVEKKNANRWLSHSGREALRLLF